MNNYLHQMESDSSPCKGVCRLDETGKCVGCFRTLDEITNWSTFTKHQKIEVKRVTQLRLQLPDFF